MRKPLLLAVVILWACGREERPGPAPVEITQVRVTGPDTLPFYGSVSLTAEVEGSGNVLPTVTWILEEGPGSLSLMTGTSVTYTAPLVLEDTPVTIRAVSEQDNSVTGAITIRLTKPPPPTTFLVGTYSGNLYTSSQEGTRYGPRNPPTLFQEWNSQRTYTLSRVSDTQLWFVETGWDNGFAVNLNDDGTLTVPARYEEGCIRNNMFSGSGTWDYRGNFYLHWFSDLELWCLYPYGASAQRYEYYESRFTGVKQ